MLRKILSATVMVITCTLLPLPALAEDPPEVTWVEGPATVELASVARVNLRQNYIFLNGEDTNKAMKYAGEPTDSSCAGMITSAEDNYDWSVMFFYDAIGYVKDDEKSTLDAGKILDSIKQGTEEGNKTRVKNGLTALNVIGWYEEPHYDTQTHNLVWAILAENADDHSQIVNYDTRLLGRRGYIAVKFIAEPASLGTYIGNLKNIISDFSWTPGNSYSEWLSGDKVAEIGLTALIAGGAGAVAAQTGLLAKIWKFLVAGAAAIGGVIWRFAKRIFGKKERNDGLIPPAQG